MNSKAKKIAKVMREFKKDELKSSSGQKVTDRRQALAIALSEARRMKKRKLIKYIPARRIEGEIHADRK